MNPLEAADALALVVQRHCGTAQGHDREMLQAARADYLEARQAAAVAPPSPLGPVTQDGIRAARAWALWTLGGASYASDLLYVATATDPMTTLAGMLGDEDETLAELLRQV